MWDFVTRNPPPAIPIHDEDNTPPEPEESQDTTHIINIDQTPPERQQETAPPPPILQRTLCHDISNTPWGDHVHYSKPHHYFQILSKM